jgi:hypothetical protein
MSRQTFAIGKEFETVSPAELEAGLGHTVRSIVLSLKQPPTVETITFPFQADAAGVVGPGAGNNQPQSQEVYQCPPGMRVDVNRITLDLAGFPTSVVNVTGRLALRRDDSTSGQLVYFWPQPGANVAPAIESYGGDAPRLNGGQRLFLVGAGLTANQAFTLNLQVTIFEDPARLVGEPRY